MQALNNTIHACGNKEVALREHKQSILSGVEQEFKSIKEEKKE